MNYLQSESDLHKLVVRVKLIRKLFQTSATDSMAVVDPQLRVRAIEGLRVVDASIMPTLTTGNTNAQTIAIGEKASDLIKAARHSSKQTRQTVTTKSSSQTLVGIKLPL